jgi:hypothetical protein
LAEPSQASATSQTPAPERQTVPDEATASPGQLALEPVQLSATSHAPDAERQTVVDATKASAGQVPLDPVQFSATSQVPALDRQTKLDGRTASAGQLAVPPAHVSARSQAPAAERQTVPDGANPLAGHVALAPEHVSARSQSPAAERQTVPEGRKPPPQVDEEPLQVDPDAHAPALHAVPAVLNLQLASQHDAAEPLPFGPLPSSQSSFWLGWTLPLPQGCARASSAVAAISAIAKTPTVRRRRTEDARDPGFVMRAGGST